MRTLALEGRMGASGDMLLGALLAAGADREALAPVEDALDVRYVVDRTTKNGIEATAVTVVLVDDSHEGSGTDGHDHSPGDGHDHSPGDGHDHSPSDGHDHEHGHDHSPGDGHDHEHGHDHSPSDGHDHSPGDGHDHSPGDGHDHSPGDGHDHSPGDGHDHSPGDGHDHTPAEGHGPSRSYAEVVDIVASMGLPGSVERDAMAIFELLGEAEASVHGTGIDDVHFHEVGADDAIADVVGVCLLLADLDIEHVVTTPLSAGGGEMEMSHGTYPVPTPAVVELAERADWSLRGGPVEAELVTPTGAAILAHHAEGVTSLPPLSVTGSGYGAGGWDFPDRPNVLRAIVGEADGRLDREPITVLETNLDDASPELLGGLQETLADAGALDVSIVPLTMKKSRPGHLVKVICAPEDARPLARHLAEETGTLGVREGGAGHRFVADREQRPVTVTIGGEAYEVRVKVASAGEDVYDVSAEYDDALGVATETGLAVREVMRRAEDAARDW